MRYVLDASVALCWVIPRPLTPKAVRLRDEYRRKILELLAPAVFVDEMAGALTKAERPKDITVGQAAPLFVKVMNSPPILIPHVPLNVYELLDEIGHGGMGVVYRARDAAVDRNCLIQDPGSWGRRCPTC